MNNCSIEERLKSLEAAFASADLSKGTRRLMDFCEDFNLPVVVTHPVVELRSRFNQGPLMGQNEFDWQLSVQMEGEKLLEQIEEIWQQEKKNRIVEEKKESKNPESNVEKPQLLQNDRVFYVKGLQKKYRSKRTQFELNVEELTLKAGQITGVVGENGNGKTTLLRIIAGDLVKTEGQMSYPFLSQEKEDWYQIKQHIAYIPQRVPRWFGRLKENLKFTASIHGIKGAENRERVNRIIHRLGLTKYEEAKWSQISSGYKLRFELAKALIWRPQLLVLDEPLANLDINTRDTFLQDLRFLANSLKSPLSIILSSQQLHEVENVSDNIVFLENGKCLYNGKMTDFGKERKHNIYELKCNEGLVSLQEKLQDIEKVVIQGAGQLYVIKTPVHLDSGKLLQHLISKNIQPEYFREITYSTRKLFRTTQL